MVAERRMQPARGRFARFDLDRQIASTFPAHWKVGPAPVFWASQPLEPAEWLALLILKAGDVESNPGPQTRKLPPSALTTQTTTLNSTTHSHATTSHPNKKLLTLLQLNINSITNKHEELKLLVTELQPDIITIQETKLKKHNKTQQIPTYSAIRTDRANGKGGGLLTYIKHNITFSDTKIPNFINPINTELQIIQLHITHKKIYTIANIYIPPRNTTSPDHATCDADITSCIQYITNLPNSIISGDINAHSPIWHSHTTDHRGDLIADLNTGTSFRPISLLSVISKTLEKALLPYITNNIPQHHTQHGFKAKHSTTTALHNINNTIASGFNQRIPPARTIAVALDMSKAFDTVNIHTLTKKLLDTQIPPILIKFIANYIKGRKAFTTYNNKTSTQRQFKTGVPQGGVLSPTLFNIYTSDIPSPPPNINITVYADDITMTSTDTNKQIAHAKLQPYLQEIASWTQQNQLHLNPDKTTSTLFTPDPAEYSTQLTLNIDNVVIPTVKNPKILGLTFDPKLTYNSHIRKTSDKARNTLKLLKALTSTKWGKQKETIVATYKAITRPILEYASTIWSPIASTTGITKLQTIQNMALRIATGCTSDTNIQHLHNETNILPLNAHLKLHSSQLRQKSQHPTHPLHKFTVLTENERHKKQTIFDNNNNYTVNINTKSDLICEDLIQSNLKLIHSHIVSNHLSQRPPNKVLQDQTPSVSPAELLLSRETRRTLAQLRTNKSPLLVSYLFSIGDPRHPSPLCPLCLMHDHTSSHLFECKSLPTSLSSLDLWTNPDKVEPFLATWGERLLAAT